MAEEDEDEDELQQAGRARATWYGLELVQHGKACTRAAEAEEQHCVR